MQRKTKITVSVLIVLAAVAAASVAFAFMFRKDSSTNTFTPAEVSCCVHEKLDKIEVDGSLSKGSEKSDICLENTGNIKEYLRVRLVSFFTNAQGEVSGALPSVLPEIVLNDGWLAGENNTYYYTLPVEPGGITPPLCAPFLLCEKTAPDGALLYQNVEVFAEAIQAEPSLAVQQAWNVSVNADKSITLP